VAPGRRLRRYDQTMTTTGPARSDADLARAVISNWEALGTALAVGFHGAVEDTPAVFRFRSGLHSGFLNEVMRVDADPNAVPELAAEMRRWFPAGLPWRWVVGPGSSPEGLADLIEAEGFERRWPLMPTMTVDLDSFEVDRWASREAIVEEITDPAGMEDWLAVRRANLHLDEQTIAAWRRAHTELGLGPGSPIRQFVGRIEGRPLAACTVFLDEPGGTAGIYHVDVVPEARGRGLAKSVTAAALGAARDLRYPLGVLSASTLGTPVYLRLGFRIVGGIAVFVGAAH
jgi:GNAT superfamily N-acetyltransferase